MADTVAGDRVAEAITAVARQAGTWRGSASELLDALTPHRGEDRKDGWPTSPAALSGLVRRLAVPLRTVGVEVETGREKKGRWIKLRAPTGDQSGGDGGDGGDGRTLSRFEQREEEGGKARVETTVTTVTEPRPSPPTSPVPTAGRTSRPRRSASTPPSSTRGTLKESCCDRPSPRSHSAAAPPAGRATAQTEDPVDRLHLLCSCSSPSLKVSTDRLGRMVAFVDHEDQCELGPHVERRDAGRGAGPLATKARPALHPSLASARFQRGSPAMGDRSRTAMRRRRRRRSMV